jgi:hypothetical protein
MAPIEFIKRFGCADKAVACALSVIIGSPSKAQVSAEARMGKVALPLGTFDAQIRAGTMTVLVLHH